MRKRIISISLENEAGALSRVVGLFSSRGYNIDTLNVAPTEDLNVSRITAVTHCSDEMTEQIIKHLYRLIEVVKVVEVTESSHVSRELLQIKVRAQGKARDELIRQTEIFRGRVIDGNPNSYTIELTGKPSKIDAFIQSCDSGTILEMTRSGVCAINRSLACAG